MAFAPRVFVTGASGYIGGHVVDSLIRRHPEYTLVLLVRNDGQKAQILARWPNLTTVIGDLDTTEILIEEGRMADVVLQLASADHVPGVEALIAGLGQRLPSPGYFIHVSGTGMLNDVSNSYGQPASKVYHDVGDVVEITSLPIEGHLHRDIDKAVIEAGLALHVPTAILSPPMIHGVGKGPVKTRSIQVPLMIEAAIKRGKGFQILEGQNIWDYCHIDDVSNGFILLLEEALQPDGGKAAWGKEGYYYCEAGEFTWGSVATAIAQVAYEQAALPSPTVDKLSVEDAAALHPWGPLIWGGNCRSRAQRLRQLEWKPEGPTWAASLPSMVKEEVKQLGGQNAVLTFGVEKNME